MKEYPTNGVVRRLNNRDSWNHIWKTRISKDIFLPQKIQKRLEPPLELCLISKQTKTRYHKQVSYLRGIQK